MDFRTRVTTGLAAGALALAALPAGATPAAFPDVISLPDGFQPEGIAVGGGPTAYAGSLATGDIVEVDLRTGVVETLVDADSGPAVGLSLSPDAGELFVAGGPVGTLKVYDTGSGDELAAMAVGSGFVNDVVVTRDAAYLTNSFAPEFYRVPLDVHGLPTGDVETVALSGDWQQAAAFSANGIEATPDGASLLIINSGLGILYDVDPTTGSASAIEIDGSLTAGDGIELTSARTVQVVRNSLNLVTTVKLSSDLTSGTVVSEVTDPDFDVPTTIASLGATSWVVNARFSTAPTPDTTYTLVRVG
jgi:sugar lactone lactonase YvrE